MRGGGMTVTQVMDAVIVAAAIILGDWRIGLLVLVTGPWSLNKYR
jgi:hypothetical protein